LHVLSQVAVTARHLTLDVRTNASERHPQAVENPGGDAVVLAHQAKEQVLGADVVLTEPRCLFLGEEDHATRPFGEPLPHIPLTLLATGCHQTTPAALFEGNAAGSIRRRPDLPPRVQGFLNTRPLTHHIARLRHP
jgi:hypothetical protein